MSLQPGTLYEQRQWIGRITASGKKLKPTHNFVHRRVYPPRNRAACKILLRAIEKFFAFVIASPDMIDSMPRFSRDLHGSVPDESAAALLLLDVISDFEFPDADRLFNHAASMLPRLTALKARARQAGIPAVYVNDNFGRWTSDFRRSLDHCLSGAVRGEPIARALAPFDDDYSVLKPKHSGFFGTSLELVLNYLGVSSLIITGFTTDICVAFTAADAYMRGYRLWIPSDCAAAVDARHHSAALSYMKRVLGADVRSSTEVDLKAFQLGAD